MSGGGVVVGHRVQASVSVRRSGWALGVLHAPGVSAVRPSQPKPAQPKPAPPRTRADICSGSRTAQPSRRPSVGQSQFYCLRPSCCMQFCHGPRRRRRRQRRPMRLHKLVPAWGSDVRWYFQSVLWNGPLQQQWMGRDGRDATCPAPRSDRPPASARHLLAVGDALDEGNEVM